MTVEQALNVDAVLPRASSTTARAARHDGNGRVHAHLHSAGDWHAEQWRIGRDRSRPDLFIVAATDDLIKAIEIQTGEILWSDVVLRP